MTATNTSILAVLWTSKPHCIYLSLCIFEQDNIKMDKSVNPQELDWTHISYILDI